MFYSMLCPHKHPVSHKLHLNTVNLKLKNRTSQTSDIPIIYSLALSSVTASKCYHAKLR